MWRISWPDLLDTKFTLSRIAELELVVQEASLADPPSSVEWRRADEADVDVRLVREVSLVSVLRFVCLE